MLYIDLCEGLKMASLFDHFKRKEKSTEEFA